MGRKNLYGERDCSKLEPHYANHVCAMTGENLHSKSDIAAELAWRDVQIAELQKQSEILSIEVSDGIADRLGLVRSEAELKTENKNLDEAFRASFEGQKELHGEIAMLKAQVDQIFSKCPKCKKALNVQIDKWCEEHGGVIE